MTDIDRQSLRDFMATEVMGWELYIPDFQDEWDHSSFINPKNKKEYLPRADWQPDLDSNQLDMLVDKMVEDGWGYVFYNCHHDPETGFLVIEDTWGWFSKDGNGPAITASHPDRRLAVLLAIKAAKEAKLSINTLVPNCKCDQTIKKGETFYPGICLRCGTPYRNLES